VSQVAALRHRIPPRLQAQARDRVAGGARRAWPRTSCPSSSNPWDGSRHRAAGLRLAPTPRRCLPAEIISSPTPRPKGHRGRRRSDPEDCDEGHFRRPPRRRGRPARGDASVRPEPGPLL